MSLSRLVIISGLSSLAAAVLLGGINSSQKATKKGGVMSYSVTPQFVFTEAPPALASATQVATPQNIPTVSQVSTPPPSQTSLEAIAQKQNIQRVGYCNGLVSQGANFRSAPTLNPGSILGVVEIGEEVEITGRFVVNEGIQWVKVIYKNALAPSANPESVNQDLRPGQTGFVASCNLARS
jgi:hypothetical protein